MTGFRKTKEAGKEIIAGCDVTADCQACPFRDCYAVAGQGRFHVPEHIKIDPKYRRRNEIYNNL